MYRYKTACIHPRAEIINNQNVFIAQAPVVTMPLAKSTPQPPFPYPSTLRATLAKAFPHRSMWAYFTSTLPT